MDQVRDVLAAVAEGRLTPEEAAARLDAIGRPPGAGNAPLDAGRTARSIRIRTAGHTLQVVGDPSVTEAIAEGSYVASHDGDTLVIASEGADEEDGFRFGPLHRGHDHRGARGHRFLFRAGWVWDRKLFVRVNPKLPIEIETIAGSLNLTGIRAPIKVDSSASSVKLEDVVAPLDVTVNASSAKIWTRLQDGESAVRCNSSSVTVHLERGSNVKVRAHGSMGRILLPDDSQGAHEGGWLIDGAGDYTMGTGSAVLDINASVSNVKVLTDR
jgi:hypothetical protein